MTEVKDGPRDPILARAQGCLLGQLAGDSLGSLVEFKTPEEIRQRYPTGVRELADGGTWGTIAGQPTDDSELALALARVLIRHRRYDPIHARESYVAWLESDPFDCGATISSGLRGRPNAESQANGAMMRVSPLGIFGARHDLERVGMWARQDAGITHPNHVCVEANALFAKALAYAIRSGCSRPELYCRIVEWAQSERVDLELLSAVKGAETDPPADFVHLQGWVLIAFRNALWQLLYAQSLEEAVVETVMRGGDTDTNAAICGALMGALCGRAELPMQWIQSLLRCTPKPGLAGVRNPRPERYWPVDALELAEQLVDPQDRRQSPETA